MKLASSKLTLKLVCVALMLALAGGPSGAEARLADYLPSFRLLNPFYWLGWSSSSSNQALATNATSLKPSINRSDNGGVSNFSSRVEPQAQQQQQQQMQHHQARTTTVSIRPVSLQPLSTPAPTTSTTPAATPATRSSGTREPQVQVDWTTTAANESSPQGSSPMPNLYTATNGSILNLFTTQKPREKPQRSQMKYIIKKKNVSPTNSTQLWSSKPSFATIS